MFVELLYLFVQVFVCFENVAVLKWMSHFLLMLFDIKAEKRNIVYSWRS